VKFLIDANLSPKVGVALIDVGFEASHIVEHELQHATDEEIFDWASASGRVIVTADSDFGMLLAFSRAKSPSVIQLRGVAEMRAEAHIALLVDNVVSVLDELANGAVVTINPDRLRVRGLPIERWVSADTYEHSAHSDAGGLRTNQRGLPESRSGNR